MSSQNDPKRARHRQRQGAAFPPPPRRSKYDRNSDNYPLPVALADLSAVLIALGIAPAVLIGSFYGGLLTMMLAVMRPTAIAGAILNDIGSRHRAAGPGAESRAIGEAPRGAQFRAGCRNPPLAVRRALPEAHTAGLDRLPSAPGASTAVGSCPNYDPKLTRTLQGADLLHPLARWNQFDALAHVPLMVIRGANSDILASTTLDVMLARRGELDVAVVPDQGHAPLQPSPG